MKQIATIICIAGLAGLSTSVFSFPAAATADTSEFDWKIPANKGSTTNVLPISQHSNLSQSTHIAASGTEADNKSASQSAIQGNEMQDERMEFEEEAARREFGDESNREDFKEQEIRREFGGRTEFVEPVPEAEDHDH
ncbi:hypothetical protein SAMN05216339_10412 [Nitrosomonas eutropha]|uniref:Uncharacterized protein n=1 Tax=Nitrosomonas eutropha TaxID=916 RepID=A0A1I7H2T1_9PROT|nr:hypothetical protein [Nitrosomonas eutropha]SFU54922.1 hypothetical protein SAMN05216339_10412 [Nitrosomonas eutropha]